MMGYENLSAGICSNCTISPAKKPSNKIFALQHSFPGVWNSAVFSRRFPFPSSYQKNRLRCSNTSQSNSTCKGGDEGTKKNVIRRKRLAVFVSGNGSNFRSIHEASMQCRILGDVVALVTNKRGCGGAEYARDNGIPVLLFPRTNSELEGLCPTDLVAVLKSFKLDFILLAGYLKLIPPELIQNYPKSILNIHPSLLPAFGGKGYYGMKVHEAVISSGARFSGPTIHFVDKNYDTGRILAQKAVPVLANDSAHDLSERVLHEEHKLYVDVVAALCEERVVWRDDGVPLIRHAENPNMYS